MRSPGAGGRGYQTMAYKVLHRWLTYNYPKTDTCEKCGEVAKDIGPRGTHFAFLYHPATPTRERSDYLELCPTCHRRMDRLHRELSAQFPLSFEGAY